MVNTNRQFNTKTRIRPVFVFVFSAVAVLLGIFTAGGIIGRVRYATSVAPSDPVPINPDAAAEFADRMAQEERDRLRAEERMLTTKKLLLEAEIKRARERGIASERVKSLRGEVDALKDTLHDMNKASVDSRNPILPPRK